MRISMLFIILCLCLSACGPGQMLGPTITPSPTTTSTITLTPTSTQTNTPTVTMTPEPTDTPVPTDTPTALPTPIGSGMGKIVYVSEEIVGDKTVSNIYVMNSDGSDPIKLSNNTNPLISPFFPRWSADGSKIVFTRGDDTGSSNKSEIFIMDADGSDVQKLSPTPQYKGRTNVDEDLRDYYSDMAPNKDLIAFTSNRHSLATYTDDAEIYILDTSTYEITQLTNKWGDSQHPSWSPDGEQIAFMSSRDGDWEIFVMKPDGSDVKQLTKNTFSDRFPRWSPDGSKLIFHSDRDGNIELYTISLADLTETRLTNNPASDATASWSPDGEWITFYSDRDGDNDIYIMRVDGSESRNLTNNDVSDSVAFWSP